MTGSAIVPKRICFVVNELYPLNKGGIGRWVFNTLLAGQSDGVEFTVLLYGPNFHVSEPDEAADIEEAIGSLANVLFLSDLLEEAPEIHVCSRDAFDEFASESIYIYGAFEHLALNEGVVFDVIEFIDFGGPAFFLTQARKGKPWLADTKISIRLHSTNSLIVEHEVYDTIYSTWHAKVHDIERKALRDADIVVGHIPAIAAINCDYYHFDEDWLDKVAIDTPPVLLDEAEEGNPADRVRHEEPTFAFTARLAPFKRPDLFIEAAVRYLDRGKKASFVLASYGWDHVYETRLRRMVPDRYADRIRFAGGLGAAERIELIRDAIIVIPSIYESFCFLAFESLLRGQQLILNAACAAFGRYEFWQDQKNCLMFDGSADALVRVMERAVDWRPTDPAIPQPTPPYWRTVASAAVAENVLAAERPTLAVIKVAGADRVNMIPPCSGPQAPFRPYDRAWSGVWTNGADLRAVIADADYVSFTANGMVQTEAFLAFARQALESHPEFQGVVPQILDPKEEFGFGLHGGDLVASSVMDSAKIGIFGAVFRTSFILGLASDDADGDHWLHAAIVRGVLDGARLIAYPGGGVTLLGRRPDPILRAEMQSGILKRFSPLFQTRFGAAITDTSFTLVEHDQRRINEYRERLQAAEDLARDRYAAMQDMEALIISRDNHIAADGLLLRERFDVIQQLAQASADKDRHLQSVIDGMTEVITAKDAELAEREAAIRSLEGKLRHRGPFAVFRSRAR